MESDNSLVVNETFFSIQGESTYAGRPCVFLRLTYCNLRCSYCDTEYAFYEGQRRSLTSILEELVSYPTDLIEITGGEPLLQKPVFRLIQDLLEHGKTVLIETSGSCDIEAVDPRAILIYDIKCPGSGMESRNRWANIPLLRSHDEIKFVVASRADYEWARQKVQELGLCDRHTVLFSAVWGAVDPKALAEWILQDGLPVRLQMQLHKILWGAETRGV